MASSPVTCGKLLHSCAGNPKSQTRECNRSCDSSATQISIAFKESMISLIMQRKWVKKKRNHLLPAPSLTSERRQISADSPGAAGRTETTRETSPGSGTWMERPRGFAHAPPLEAPPPAGTSREESARSANTLTAPNFFIRIPFLLRHTCK